MREQMINNGVLMTNRMAGNTVLKYSEFSTQRFVEANVCIMGRPELKEGVSDSSA
jgi:hypothetical protein